MKKAGCRLLLSLLEEREMESKMKIAVLGVTGMIGHKIFAHLSKFAEYQVFGFAKDSTFNKYEVFERKSEKIIEDFDAENYQSISRHLSNLKPDIVINCIGIVKQSPEIANEIKTISVNSLFPHMLEKTCRTLGIRMIHISTDCVFKGTKGDYVEEDDPDATDLYGRTKILGEVVKSGCLTIRTSTIGHELKQKHGLLEWFLAQEDQIYGFMNAIYTGIPTVELADVIEKHIIPNPDISGLYHVSAGKISKFELLRMIASIYGKDIRILEERDTIIDRSLDSSSFRKATGYNPPGWQELLEKMFSDHNN